MSYVGDYDLSKTFYHRFTTVNASGLPTTLGNTPSLAYCVDAGTTAFTAGLSLTADVGGITGRNLITVIATTSATGIVGGANISVHIAAGTVSGVSVVGYPVIEYSITNRSPLRPATAGRTLLVSSTGYGAIDWAAIGTPGATVSLSATTLFTATNVTNNVGAVVTAINTIAPARVTAQGIDIGAIVTACNTVVPANVTAASTNVGAIVTASSINIGAVVTACNTVVPANVTAASINIGAIVTACNTVVPANVTSFSASGLAQLFTINSGTTYAASVTGSPVKEIADNAGGASLTVAAIVSGVWEGTQTANGTVVGSFGEYVNATVSSRLATSGYTAPLTAAGTRTALGMASADLDTQLAAIPTDTENADALLNRDMSLVSDTNARSPLNAIRFLRNKWSMSGTTLTVTKEDDTTSAWTSTTTQDATAVPITGNDPA